jgi:hypothetical protein
MGSIIFQRWTGIVFVVLFLFFGWTGFVHAFDIEIKIPSRYSEVKAGEEVGFDVDIDYSENPTRKEIKLEYEIKKDDEVIFKDEDLKFIESSALFAKFITVPENVSTGLYTLNVRVTEFDNVLKTDSANFYAVGNQEERIKMYFLFALGLAISLVFGFIMVKDLIKRKDFDTEEE